MMRGAEGGHYRVRLAVGAADLTRVMALRRQVFRGGAAEDGDEFDATCRHLIIEDAQRLAAAMRLHRLSGAEVQAGYTGQVYDLTRLARHPGPMLELGRFCLAPGRSDPDILRLAWGALAAVVDAEGIALMFGCVSFAGADSARHCGALAWLAAGHLGPEAWRPAGKGRAVPFADLAAGHRADPAGVPPLLRSYLLLGGWVSDCAVPDPDLNTLHVFTAVEVARIPPARARALRAIAAAYPALAVDLRQT